MKVATFQPVRIAREQAKLNKSLLILVELTENMDSVVDWGESLSHRVENSENFI